MKNLVEVQFFLLKYVVFWLKCDCTYVFLMSLQQLLAIVTTGDPPMIRQIQRGRAHLIQST